MKHPRTTAALTLLLSLATAAPALADPATAAPRADDAVVRTGDRADDRVVRAVERAAHPLRSTEPSAPDGDLRPLDRMIGDARVVGMGEATHSSRDFFALKQRTFRHLVRDKGFRTYALEAPWSTGLRLNDYVLHGKGDPRRILREDFQDAYLFWNTREYLSLLTWMRSWNRDHPDDPVRFMGNDVAYAGPELHDRVLDHVRATRPAALPRLAELYRGLRPDAPAGPYMRAYLAKPLAERRALAERAGQALELVRSLRPGSGPGAAEAHRWAVQNARTLQQTAQQYAFDYTTQDGVAASMRFRDRTMADNTAWWQRETDTKVLLSAHNGHVTYESDDPRNYPKTQGSFLRDRYGSRYVTVGLTFGRGSFNAVGPDDEMLDANVRRFTVGPDAPGSNAATLDRARVGTGAGYLLDLRTAPPPARDWLRQARPTRNIGTAYPYPAHPSALASSFDLLIHLHRIDAAERLPADGG
ncbi:erythromycin esterase family protein [Streptomyces sp. AV19]|uniref:erythromycin esterase family protein n=1 Tax=Streptomyces sp. AV19 TaxID=2793068 RepID=UPI0018FE4439|nr:erythromycin esterase family protein [Streptomyces sp. AV19]MBH1938755.1 erythromycin esterase family protein [Streptomyces sp. AV19]MDG4533970.1 erythromycin esterase family protein [Streptomyces sp. AV19]